ncbi:MAG: endonuclease/exonuclease/phosphatase family protein [Gemmatimonadota bacterium]
MPIARIATYNIHECIGRDRRVDPHRTAAVLAELHADVIALQELRSPYGALRTLEFLAERTGMYAVEGPTMQKAGASYGNALLSRTQPVEVRGIDLSVAGREPRGALDVQLAIAGRSLRVVATHLGLRPAERRRQVRRLLDRVGPDLGMPLVLTGDLNEWFLWGRPLRWLHAVFQETPSPATFPSGRPVFALDRLWVRPRALLKAVDVHHSAAARVASDHLPLVATLRV